MSFCVIQTERKGVFVQFKAQFIMTSEESKVSQAKLHRVAAQLFSFHFDFVFSVFLPVLSFQRRRW